MRLHVRIDELSFVVGDVMTDFRMVNISLFFGIRKNEEEEDKKLFLVSKKKTT